MVDILNLLVNKRRQSWTTNKLPVYRRAMKPLALLLTPTADASEPESQTGSLPSRFNTHKEFVLVDASEDLDASFLENLERPELSAVTKRTFGHVVLPVHQ